MLMQTTGPVLAETTFYSLWPNLVLHLPSSHLALTANVVMEIRSSATCGSRLHREFLSLVLTYQRTKGTEGTATRLSQPVVLEMTNFTAIDKNSSQWIFECQAFDLEGSYQASLQTSSGHVICTSNIMEVKFNAAYRLSVERPSVFPCNDTIEVTYTQPPCAGAGGKIRLFSLHRSPGSLAAPLQHRYVTEQVVHPDKNTLAFSCSHLNQTVTGYCFVYVTVARLGAVVPQRELCLPFHADAGTATYVTNSTS